MFFMPRNIKSNFSDQARRLIEKSREVALDLGYDHISTIHFFLADSLSEQPYSIKDFAFKTPADLQQFYNTQRVSEFSLFGDQWNDSIPITMEAELTLKNSVKEQKKYRNKFLEPFHIFLAASQLEESLFCSVLTPKNETHARLVNYYKKLGCIS